MFDANYFEECNKKLISPRWVDFSDIHIPDDINIQSKINYEYYSGVTELNNLDEFKRKTEDEELAEYIGRYLDRTDVNSIDLLKIISTIREISVIFCSPYILQIAAPSIKRILIIRKDCQKINVSEFKIVSPDFLAEEWADFIAYVNTGSEGIDG